MNLSAPRLITVSCTVKKGVVLGGGMNSRVLDCPSVCFSLSPHLIEGCGVGVNGAVITLSNPISRFGGDSTVILLVVLMGLFGAVVPTGMDSVDNCKLGGKSVCVALPSFVILLSACCG